MGEKNRSPRYFCATSHSVGITQFSLLTVYVIPGRRPGKKNDGYRERTQGESEMENSVSTSASWVQRCSSLFDQSRGKNAFVTLSALLTGDAALARHLPPRINALCLHFLFTVG